MNRNGKLYTWSFESSCHENDEQNDSDYEVCEMLSTRSEEISHHLTAEQVDDGNGDS